MKKAIFLNALLVTSLLVVSPVFAATGDVGKIDTFIKSIVQILVTLAGTVAVVFFVLGGLGYITSTGNPEALDKSKKTILYSAIGLVVVLGAFILSNIVNQLATGAFGSTGN